MRIAHLIVVRDECVIGIIGMCCGSRLECYRIIYNVSISYFSVIINSESFYVQS